MKQVLPVRTSYSGPKWVLYIWWVITLVTLGRSIVHIVLPDGGAMSIASIPLDQYSFEAQETIIAMFALWGLSQLLVGMVYVVVLVRQQSWIPFWHHPIYRLHLESIAVFLTIVRALRYSHPIA